MTRPAPWTFAAPWGARGYVTDLGSPVHWIEFDGQPRPRGEPPIVFVHGLGGSHLNWCLIGPRLAEGRRAVALDLHGFGLTPGTRATSTVQRNTALLDRFVREVTGTPVILAGNSMGGLISIMQASGAPDTVAGLVLIDPATERHRQGPGTRDEAFLAASRSLMRVVGLRGRYWEMMASVRVPVLLIGGEADRLVPAAAMRRAAGRNPGWETVIMPGVGHTPQLEAPGTVAGRMRDWLGRHFAPARVE